jgi:hypothetical protein
MAGIVITTQPTSAVVNKNRTATLSVSATATAGTLNYDWYEDATVDVLLQSGTSNTFTPLPLTLSKSYYVKVWTSDAPTVFVTSNVITITVIDPPVISAEPVGSTINSGESATLNVTVAPSPNLSPVTYQWYLGASGLTDNPVVGATLPSYTITNVTDSQTFWVRVQNEAGYDDSIGARIGVVEPLYDDSDAIRQEKAAVFGGSFGSGSESDSILSDFPLDSIKVLSQAKSLSDCAKNLPNRLMDLAVGFATKKVESLLKDTTGVTFEDLQKLKDKYDSAQRVIERIQNLSPKKATLLDAINTLRSATGIDLIEKTNKVLNDFAAVGGISDIVSKALSSDICKVTNYGLDGNPTRSTTNIPMGIPPSSVEGIEIPVGNSNYNSLTKQEYDSFIFQLKEYIEPDQSLLSSLSGKEKENYTSSISYLNTITMAYHDKLIKTVDNSKDAQYRSEFDEAIKDTLVKNLSWDSYTITQFKDRGVVISDIINRNAQVIRNFLGKSPAGVAAAKGVTVYSGPESDFTTFLDIKPSQRPPELTQKYLAQGKRIPPGDTYTNSKGKTFKIGTLNYSDAFNGAYGGALVSDRSVASTRFPGGSILALKNPDGSPYNPSGKNLSGEYIVDDTGNLELTYKKVDIFTRTPNLYTNTENILVYLLKEGTKQHPKFKQALAKFGKGYGNSIA